MSNLKPNTPYEGYARSWNELSLAEVSDFEIISLAVANGQKLGGKSPKPGTWIQTKNGKLLWTGQNQYFLLSDGVDDRLDEKLSEQYGDHVYCTLQTDGWAALEIKGTNVHDVLERFIPLDLRLWHKGQGARTSAHHISVIVMKMDDDAYRLLTPRSSSQSFLQALEEIISHVFA